MSGRTVVVITVYAIVMLGLGHLVGSGFSVEVKWVVSGFPSRIWMGNVSSWGWLDVAARVWGKGFTRVWVNATTAPIAVASGFTSGLDCSQSNGGYLCTGVGFVYEPRGFVEELITWGNATRYYYAGWIHVAVYSVIQSMFMGVIMAPLASLLTGLYGLRGRGARVLAATAAVGAMAFILGFETGVAYLPRGLTVLDDAVHRIALASLACSLACLALGYRLPETFRRRARTVAGRV